MKSSVVVSAGLHATILAVSILGLTAAKPLDGTLAESVPIDIITPSEFDALTKGAKTSKVIDKPPAIQADKVAEQEPEEKAELKEAKQEVKAPPPPPPPTPEVKPEPPKPEPPKVAEAKPEPPKPQPPKPPEVKPPEQVSEDGLQKPKPPEKVQEQAKPEPPKPEQPKVAEAKPAPKPPVKAPPPPKKVEQPQKPTESTYSADKIAALLDKRAPVRTASASREISPTTTAGIPRGTASKLSLSQRSAIDGALREQVSPCWNPPIGAVGADALRVTVRFQLNQDGTLEGQPDVVQWQSTPGFQAAADSALRAVRRCSPLRLPAEAYDYWRDVQITFDPRDMLRG